MGSFHSACRLNFYYKLIEQLGSESASTFLLHNCLVFTFIQQKNTISPSLYEHVWRTKKLSKPKILT